MFANISRRIFNNTVPGWSAPEEQAQQNEFHYILIHTSENKFKECQHVSESHVKTCFAEKPHNILFEDFNYVWEHFVSCGS